jgi:hypothetical protein
MCNCKLSWPGRGRKICMEMAFCIELLLGRAIMFLYLRFMSSPLGYGSTRHGH